MKLLVYSDLHLEFRAPFVLPSEDVADVLILAGDIIVLDNYKPLDKLLKTWQKPVIYVTGNHEYYTCKPLGRENMRFREWLEKNHPQVKLLINETCVIDDVHFFGGTMWTEFEGGDEEAMARAQRSMVDYQRIHTDAEGFYPKGSKSFPITPHTTMVMHETWRDSMHRMMRETLAEKDISRVVITHHAPVINPNTKYRPNSPLQPAFNSLDAKEFLIDYRPEVWVYGHTHECDDHVYLGTRIVSNQRGYPGPFDSFECTGYKPEGLIVEVGKPVL